jgi:hypothetical protein
MRRPPSQAFRWLSRIVLGVFAERHGRAAMTSANHDRLNEWHDALVAIGLIGLGASLMVGAMLRLEDSLVPQVGDIIVFGPAKKISAGVQEPITVTPTGAPNATACVLDLRIMLESGGSIVIKATQPKPNRRYRVDWAGARTSDGRTNCGATAEFLLGQPEIVALKLAGGR